MKKLDKKGFTLAELLIVVAIIAVLVAISIPVFTAQLERSRENTDLANMRAAKAEVLAYALESAEQHVLDASGATSTDDSTKFAVATTYVYDATTGDLALPTYKATPYGKGTEGGDYKTEAANKVLYVSVDKEGVVTAAWDAAGTAPASLNAWNSVYVVKD